MAIKSRATLTSDSDGIFIDNTSGLIIPANHRTFNDDVIESVANLTDDNTFDGVNEFDNLVIQRQVAAYYPAGTIVDLSAADGNIIYIDGTTTIEGFVGNVGQIMYVTFVDGLVIDATGGASMRPPHNIKANAGDTFIFHFTETNVVRVLGHWRQNGQQWFQLADVTAYQDLVNAEALQIGSQYLIINGYEYPTGFSWSILFRALSSNLIDTRAYIGRNGGWIPVSLPDGTLDPGTMPISTMSDFADRLTFDEWLANAGSPQWTTGGSAVIELPEEQFYAHAPVDSGNVGIRRNLLNFYNKDEPYFGRILFSELNSANKFYPHDGNYSAWGNNLDFEAGITPLNLVDWNLTTHGNEVAITSIIASYTIVNDTCTIYFQMTGDNKFDLGTSGHEFYLYMPLPFEAVGNYCGNGSVRFTDINNRHDNGAIVTAVDQYSCLFSSKWQTAISSTTGIIASGSYTYKAIGENFF